jgi:predicted nucleic acid-binding protein
MTQRFVVDNSVTLAWVIDDEINESSEKLFDLAQTNGVVVPLLWKIENANTLLICEKRARIKQSQLESAIARYALLNIEIDPHTLTHIWGKTLDLARQYNLTVYDATYLELALRRNLPLASDDKDLRKAAAAAGVQLL